MGKGESSVPFMKHSWKCWSRIAYIAFASWKRETATVKFNGKTSDLQGYNYKYFSIDQHTEITKPPSPVTTKSPSILTTQSSKQPSPVTTKATKQPLPVTTKTTKKPSPVTTTPWSKYEEFRVLTP